MARYVNIDKQKMGNINKRNILNCILENKSINRSAIASAVGLSIPAVMSITEELINKKMVQSMGKAETGVGKHPELLSVRGDHYRFIGVDIGRIHMRAAITDLAGEVIGSGHRSTDNAESPELLTEDICSLVHELIERSEVNPDTIVGVCVGMPGLIEQETGRVVFSPNFGWNDVPLCEWLNRKLAPLHVIVKSANRAQARYEVRPGALNGDKTTVFCIGLGYGIGSAMINEGKMYYGASGTSGEIGHITVNPNGPMCTCGNSGCLEAMSSGYSIELLGKKKAENNRDGMIYRLVNGDTDKIDARVVFRAAEAYDLDAMEIIDQAAKYIGIGLATAINMLDPDIIYLCGGLMKNGDDFMEKIKKYTRLRQMKLAGKHVKIKKGSMDELNVAKGAGMMILDNGEEFEKLSFLY